MFSKQFYIVYINHKSKCPFSPCENIQTTTTHFLTLRVIIVRYRITNSDNFHHTVTHIYIIRYTLESTQSMYFWKLLLSKNSITTYIIPLWLLKKFKTIILKYTVLVLSPITWPIQIYDYCIISCHTNISFSNNIS